MKPPVLSVSIRSIAVLGVLTLLSGCRSTLYMYTGPRLPSARVAFLTIPQEVRCGVVDGRRIRPDNPGRIEFLPGTHSIRIQYFGKKLRTQLTNLSWNLEPGHEYELRYRMYRAGGNRVYTPEYLKLLLSSPKEKRRTLMPETVFGANRWCPYVFDVTDRLRVTLRDRRKDREVTAILSILGRQDKLVAGMKSMQAQADRNRKK